MARGDYVSTAQGASRGSYGAEIAAILAQSGNFMTAASWAFQHYENLSWANALEAVRLVAERLPGEGSAVARAVASVAGVGSVQEAPNLIPGFRYGVDVTYVDPATGETVDAHMWIDSDEALTEDEIIERARADFLTAGQEGTLGNFLYAQGEGVDPSDLEDVLAEDVEFDVSSAYQRQQ